MAAPASGHTGAMSFTTRVWRDRQERPGPLPNSPLAPVTLVVAVAAGLAAGALVHGALAAIVVIGVGLCGFWVAARLTPERHRKLRYTRGPGWYVGPWLAERSLRTARVLYALMGAFFVALGVAALVLGFG